ncbi:uncharacterized protein C8Q71DRAFT_884173 [Rhodofomes roseus]|uniref:Uncharacterized protein n=1 Tax=Rhodofomes roseus TaxID=34475 RepID=A0ABQ8KRJ2_9APHY|nr:uncharacterized protein C8Q71DRAFT_884173 [Rhodofomes roseus]KAH9841416.1 hypothetical protein C8Q71DRAFT_884173 [Rhodofomes roseus]
MASLAWLFLALCPPSLLAHARPSPDANLDARGAPPSPLWRRASVPAPGFYNPTDNGGTWLTVLDGTFPAGQGEAINVVISGDSDSAVLVNQEPDGGLLNYFVSFGYSTECLGQHDGTPQRANLGDGNGYANQTAEIRWDYGDPELGTCQETIEGGSHFRYWIQNGDQHDTNAVFMAASYELPETDGHDIIFNGYNLGRDWLIGNVTNQTHIIPTANLTNGTSYTGQTSYDGYTYETNAQYLYGYAPNTSYAVNHNITTSNNVTNSDDGFIAVLTVKIVTAPQSSYVLGRCGLTPFV